MTRRERATPPALLLLRQIDAAVMPNGCVFCGAPRRPAEVPLCAHCHADLPRATTRPAKSGLRVHAPFAYEFPVDAAIKALKFGRHLYYAPALAALLEEGLARLGGDIDALLPVPLHWTRHTWRGFNQAEEICRPLRRRLGVPLIHNVRRRRRTLPQPGLSAAARRKNLRGAFTVRGRVDARHVLIVDDVITTGATCAQLAATIKRAGAVRVSVLAVARAAIAS